MKTPLIIQSPAKLNLMLRILNRRNDGYHNLQTVFQFIDLVDTLSFTTSNNTNENKEYSNLPIIINCQHFEIEPANNLITKAAYCLQETSQFKKKYPDNIYPNIHIDLIKRIPMGGGLGGGSSNCASTLIALNKLWSLELSNLELQSLGKKLGADVPIFIRGKSAWAEGIGENFYEIILPEQTVGLIHPNLNISTPLIFNSPYLQRDNPPLSIKDYLNGNTPNDCTSAIFHHFPPMKKLMHLLNKYNFNPQITGTGACIFLRTPPKNSDNVKALLSSSGFNDASYQCVHTTNTTSLFSNDYF